MALQFDHVELKGGESVPVHSEIQSIAPAEGAASTGGSAPASAPPTSGSSNPVQVGLMALAGRVPRRKVSGNDSGAAPAGNAIPAAGTVVAKTGNIAIRTTSFPGVLLANNAPGQQDPRRRRFPASCSAPSKISN